MIPTSFSRAMTTREVQIAGQNLTIHELCDLYDPQTGRPLTGSWLWDSALYLAEWIATSGRFLFSLEGKTVLELGAGTGLPGLITAILGATRVVLTDTAPILPALQRNVESNSIGGRVEVRELVWGSDESELGKVDLVLLSDVFYDACQMQALAKTVKLVCRKDTRIWSATEVRSYTWDCLEVLRQEGFSVVEEPLLFSDKSSFGGRQRSEKGPMFSIFHLYPTDEFQ